jgi:hypothetical protein
MASYYNKYNYYISSLPMLFSRPSTWMPQPSSGFRFTSCHSFHRRHITYLVKAEDNPSSSLTHHQTPIFLGGSQIHHQTHHTTLYLFITAGVLLLHVIYIIIIITSDDRMTTMRLRFSFSGRKNGSSS